MQKKYNIIKQRSVLCCCFFIFLLYSYSQNWSPLGSGTPKAVRALFVDTVEYKLYTGEQNSATIHIWNNFNWDSLPSFSSADFVECILKYNNKLYVVGSLNSDYCGSISIYDGNNWEYITIKSGIANYPYNCSAVWKLLVYSNELYFLGMFDSIAGIAASKIAKFDGTNWYPFPTLDSAGGGWGITAAAFYKGELYVGGNFDGTSGPNMADIARWDGVQWKSVGNGLTGANTIINSLVVYDDTLYVGGYFFKNSVDPGNCIAKWDGNQWYEVGTGINAQIFEMFVFNNELWVGGQFNNAGGVTVSRIAKWNGKEWKNVGADFNNAVFAFAELNNELYIGGGFLTVNGDTVNNIVKYNAGTGTFENVNKSHSYQIYPNPSTGKLTFKIKNDELQMMNIEVKIYNLLGEKVYSSTFNIQHSTFNIDISLQPSGIYFYQISSGEKIYSGKLVKE